MKCGTGKECTIDAESGTAKCQCISACADNTDVRRRVCSNHNETWQSDCHLFRHRCTCVEVIIRLCYNSKKIHTTKEDAEHLSRKWIDAIIWKFCDLDKQPHDRHVSRHELFPLRAPLLSMETCISDFLDNCDENSDHKITLVEWGKCLGASDAEMEDKCNQFKATQEAN
ncbi:unnamed protein product [Medioppia subpectinata]|uniref:SPARC/Testican calcium-binding domain-containing protein n=1 Tax=Medioppia subpectinata TaxID=1979941 RepID=A0A7R9L6R3_9ACAR|nr:unnamed protein product [Medioppia subpectinata]CAG2115529.1 unnamed protein product [Medioppia subpectinata]